MNRRSKTVQFEQILTGVEHELEEINVPLSYMEEFYHLRLHIDLLKRQIQERATADLASDSQS